MSIESAFRNAIRDEIAQQLEPLQDAVKDLQARSEDLGALTGLLNQLGPLGALLGGNGVAKGRRRGPGRPPGPAKRGRGRPPGRRANAANARGCAIAGCKRPARSKGYCAAHYQKLRMLDRTGRKPSAWTDFAAPGSVPDLKLPRGRAAHKAKKQA